MEQIKDMDNEGKNSDEKITNSVSTSPNDTQADHSTSSEPASNTNENTDSPRSEMDSYLSRICICPCPGGQTPSMEEILKSIKESHRFAEEYRQKLLEDKRIAEENKQNAKTE